MCGGVTMDPGHVRGGEAYGTPTRGVTARRGIRKVLIIFQDVRIRTSQLGVIVVA